MSRRAPGKNSRSVIEFAALSASACSCRRNEAARADRACRIRAPSVPASPSVAASSVSSATPHRSPRRPSASQGESPLSLARWSTRAIRVEAQSELTDAAACNAPSMPTPPARLRTTRSTNDPTTTLKCRRRSLASARTESAGIDAPSGTETSDRTTGTTRGTSIPPAAMTIHSTGGSSKPIPASTSDVETTWSRVCPVSSRAFRNWRPRGGASNSRFSTTVAIRCPTSWVAARKGSQRLRLPVNPGMPESGTSAAVGPAVRPPLLSVLPTLEGAPPEGLNGRGARWSERQQPTTPIPNTSAQSATAVTSEPLIPEGGPAPVAVTS